jgi:hypothetical protein
MDDRFRLLDREFRHRVDAGNLEYLRRPSDRLCLPVDDPVPHLADALRFEQLAIGRLDLGLGPMQLRLGAQLRGNLVPGAAIADEFT